MNRKKKFFVSVVAVVLLLSNGMTAFAGKEENYPDEALSPVVDKPSPYAKALLEPYYFNSLYSTNQERPVFSPITAPGRINPTRARNYDYSADRNEWELYCEHRYEYDERGNLTAVTEISSKGTPFRIVYYTYDEQDRLLSDTILPYSYGEWGEPFSSYYTYDAQGRLLLCDWGIYTYDAQGRLLSNVDQDGVGYTYKYDARGNLLQSTFTKYGLREIHHLTYDEWGDLDTDFVISDDCPEGWKEHEYIYDEAGNLLVHDYTIQVDEGNVKEIQYTYDEMGNVLTHFYYDGLDYSWRADELTYDAAGRLLTHDYECEPLQYSLTVIPIYFNEQYTYDAMGNLVCYTYDSYLGFDKKRYWSETKEYAYDAMGNLLRYTKTHESKDGVTIEKWEYYYD